MKSGDIFWADLDSGRRPVIILARPELARGSRVFAVPITSAKFAIRSKLPNCVPFRHGDFGLPFDCVAQGEMAGAIAVSQIDLVAGLIGELTDDAQRDLIRAVGHVMDADCEPS